jgi:hypothetical protein
MKELFDNWNKVLGGMITMTACIVLLGVVFAPALGYPIDEPTRIFVFGLINGIAIASGVNGSVTRTLGLDK